VDGVPWLGGVADAEVERWLVCFPHAGAGGTAYIRWPKLLPSHIGVRPVHPPGREARFREQSYRDARAFVGDLLPAVAALIDRPVSIFGHSLGALLAFELVRAMRREGLPPPDCLYVSGRPAPQVPMASATWALTDEGLVTVLRALDGTPPAVLDDPDLLAMFLPALRADLEMNERYQFAPEPPLDVPIVAFAAEQDDRASPHQVEEWRRETTGSFELVPVPGGHFTVMSHPELVIDRIAADAARWA
jgi:medium-chain acyl-[acyl-carrier-protein] hydrolase